MANTAESEGVVINNRLIPRKIWAAMQLHSTLDILAPNADKFCQIARQVLSQCKGNRKQILLQEVELCKGFDTQVSYCVIANAYYFLGASYRKQTILYMAKYLQDPSWIPCVESDRSRYISGRWDILGKALEGEYRFEEALRAYRIEQEIMPEYPTAYVRIAVVLSKMHQLDEAITFLKEAKGMQYYSSPSFGSNFDTVINNLLSELESKKARGYVYHSRKIK